MLGPDHPITLPTATGLILALDQLREAEPAPALGQNTLRRCNRVLSPDHPVMQYLTQAASGGHPMPGGDAAANPPDRPL